ncbi:MAG: glycosyltransferase family 39 protein [Candidatus Omnitrophota bacterium]
MDRQGKSDHIYNNTAIFSMAAVFLYTCIRAYSLSLVHDESLTYLLHVKASFWEIITYGRGIRTNNHLLNTLLIKLFTYLFGISEFVIRTPALIGHGLYLVGIYKILNLFLKRQSLLIGILLLTLHPFMLDFFSCARGYSLGLGFLIFGIYYTFKRIGQDKPSQYSLIAIVFVFLSVLSHLSFVPIFLSMICILALLESRDQISLIKQKQPAASIIKPLFKNFFLPVIILMSLLAVIYKGPIAKMKEAGEFAWEGVTYGFWKSTIASLIKVTLYNKDYFSSNLLFEIGLGIIILLIISLFVLFYRSKKKEFNLDNRYLLWITLLLIICSLAVTLPVILFVGDYPTGRAAIYFIPIFLIFSLILWKNFKFIQIRSARILINILSCLMTLVLLVHFAGCLNFTHYFMWKTDADVKEMMKYLIEINKDKHLKDNSVRMGIHWIYDPCINFYKVRYGLRWLMWVDRGGFAGRKFDYYYYYDYTKNPIHNLKERQGMPQNIKIIKKFEVSNTCLAIPKEE